MPLGIASPFILGCCFICCKTTLWGQGPKSSCHFEVLLSLSFHVPSAPADWTRLVPSTCFSAARHPWSAGGSPRQLSTFLISGCALSFCRLTSGGFHPLVDDAHCLSHCSGLCRQLTHVWNSRIVFLLVLQGWIIRSGAGAPQIQAIRTTKRNKLNNICDFGCLSNSHPPLLFSRQNNSRDPTEFIRSFKTLDWMQPSLFPACLRLLLKRAWKWGRFWFRCSMCIKITSLPIGKSSRSHAGVLAVEAKSFLLWDCACCVWASVFSTMACSSGAFFASSSACAASPCSLAGFCRCTFQSLSCTVKAKLTASGLQSWGCCILCAIALIDWRSIDTPAVFFRPVAQVILSATVKKPRIQLNWNVIPCGNY